MANPQNTMSLWFSYLWVVRNSLSYEFVIKDIEVLPRSCVLIAQTNHMDKIVKTWHHEQSFVAPQVIGCGQTHTPSWINATAFIKYPLSSGLDTCAPDRDEKTLALCLEAGCRHGMPSHTGATQGWLCWKVGTESRPRCLRDTRWKWPHRGSGKISFTEAALELPEKEKDFYSLLGSMILQVVGTTRIWVRKWGNYWHVLEG